MLLNLQDCSLFCSVCFETEKNSMESISVGLVFVFFKYLFYLFTSLKSCSKGSEKLSLGLFFLSLLLLLPGQDCFERVNSPGSLVHNHFLICNSLKVQGYPLFLAFLLNFGSNPRGRQKGLGFFLCFFLFPGSSSPSSTLSFLTSPLEVTTQLPCFQTKLEVDLKGREIYFSAFFLSIIQFVTETANLKITLTFAVLKIINYSSRLFFFV